MSIRSSFGYISELLSKYSISHGFCDIESSKLARKENNLYFINQIHGNDIVLLDKRALDWTNSDKTSRKLIREYNNGIDISNKQKQNAEEIDGMEYIDNTSRNRSDVVSADAIICMENNISIAVRTADCLPILMLFRNIVAGENIAALAIHAGWRGLAKGIIKRAAQYAMLVGSTGESSNILLTVVIGPAIHKQSYPVGEDFEKNICSKGLKYISKVNGKNHFDLSGWAIEQIMNIGMNYEIEIIDRDTYTEDSFFSYRRSQGSLKQYERNISWIRL